MKFIKDSVCLRNKLETEAQPLKQRNNNCITKDRFQEGEGIYLLYFHVQTEKLVDISREKKQCEDDYCLICSSTYTYL